MSVSHLQIGERKEKKKPGTKKVIPLFLFFRSPPFFIPLLQSGQVWALIGDRAAAVRVSERLRSLRIDFKEP